MYKGKFESSKRSIKPPAKQQPSVFKMKKVDKQRALAFIAALLEAITITSSVVLPSPPDTVAQAATDMPPALSSQQDQNLKPNNYATLGIANWGSEITINDKSFDISGSFVLKSKDEVVTFDTNENPITVASSNEINFSKVADIPVDELENVFFYEVSSESGANIRSSETISDDNIICNIPNGDHVLVHIDNTTSNSECIKAFYTNGDNLCCGYVETDLIQEIGDYEAQLYIGEQNVANINNIASVNTASANYISLKLREQPGQTILAEIPHGDFVQLLGETKQYGNKTWSLVSYTSSNGKQQTVGWVNSEDYLSAEPVQEKPSPKVREGINVNSTGNVTGIDISAMSPLDLSNLIEQGITEKTSSIHGNYDTSNLAGNINLVGIKLGASAYSPGNLEILEYNNYIQQILFCEQNKTPYVVYYYSTSINEEEALQEADIIEQRINDLKQQYGLKYCVGIAIDKELAENTKPDRQRNGNVEEQTKSLATLINTLQEKGIHDNILIYAPGRVMQLDLDQIFDLRSLYHMLYNPGNVALWQCSLMRRSGNVRENLNKDIAYGESCGFSTAITQIVLDAKFNSGEKFDINNVYFGWFMEVTNHLNIKQQTAYTLDYNMATSTDEGTYSSLDEDASYTR